MAPLEIEGYDFWIAGVETRYKNCLIELTWSEREGFIKAILPITRSSNMIVGIFDRSKGTGKVFDRREKIRDEWYRPLDKL